MNCGAPALPALHSFSEFAQTHVYWVNDAIQPSHPPLPRSFPVLNLSQHQCLFQWVDSLHQVAKVLEFQHYSRFILIIKKKNSKRDERWEGEKKEGREGGSKKRRKKRKHLSCDKLVPGLQPLLLFPLFFGSLPNLDPFLGRNRVFHSLWCEHNVKHTMK